MAVCEGRRNSSLARWPPNPSHCWALTWRTIGPMEDYWARSGGLLAGWPLLPRAECYPLARLTNKKFDMIIMGFIGLNMVKIFVPP